VFRWLPHPRARNLGRRAVSKEFVLGTRLLGLPCLVTLQTPLLQSAAETICCLTASGTRVIIVKLKGKRLFLCLRNRIYDFEHM
jgi:hypothetical protein